jgi:hypothetical protein
MALLAFNQRHQAYIDILHVNVKFLYGSANHAMIPAAAICSAVYRR